MTNDNSHSPSWLTCDLNCDQCIEMVQCPLINPDEMTTRIMTPKHRGFRKNGKENEKKKKQKEKNKRKG
jgi:hypothetical protein